MVVKLSSSYMEEVERAQTIPEKIAVIQAYLKKLEDAKKERAEWRKQLVERANHLQERRNALKDRRKQIEDEKKDIEAQKKAIAERRRANIMTDDQKKALDDEEKAVEEHEKMNQEREREESVVEDELREVEIQWKHSEDLDSEQDRQSNLVSTTLEILVNSCSPLPPPPTGPSTELTLETPTPPESSLPAATFSTLPTFQSGASVTAEEVKRLMNEAEVTKAQVSNRIQYQRKKHPRDDGGESSSAKKQH
ncbi:unnamed protein product [Eruca vesicaria subsp. sativa]|uniref:Uncharacterized protein n=1 Tax=Eruca vesicaria subsp. sativa TaxID=29727 RepID=A0ABC8KIU0_ERUVS|nr:unnamed protein product [Eruca vesicaria subsp. sativa]